MYSAAAVALMQQQIKNSALKYPQEFIAMDAAELSGIVNGYGPDRWPEDLRRAVSWIFRHYPLPAAIHDFRYEFSNGMEAARKAADSEFSANLLTIWQEYYGRWRLLNPLAWFDRCKINAAVVLTRRFGRSAWLEAYHRQNGGEK